MDLNASSASVLKLLRIALCFALLPIGIVHSQSSSRPNIVIILADDLGYGDAQCYNPHSKIPTPSMDRIAKNGLRFTDAHTPSSVCTPTRYGLLTGQYSWRTRLTSGVLDGFSPPLIALKQLTIASLLKQTGYDTACLGKWHLGMQWTRNDGRPETSDRGGNGFRGGDDLDFTAKLTGGPCDVGFDSFFGISASLDMPPYCWIENDRCAPVPDGATEDFRKELFKTQTPGRSHHAFQIDQVLPTLKKRTTARIDQHFAEKSTSPLFLYLPLNSPHLPVAPSSEFLGKSQAGLYGDFVVETDDFVGAVLDAFDRHHALENTLVIVTSDNGGLWHQWKPQAIDDVKGYKPTERAMYTAGFGHNSNADLRGTKADIYEGGHRVAFLLQWPKAVPASRVVTKPIELTDVLATVADVVDVTLPKNLAHDSYSFAELLGIPPKNPANRELLVHHSINGTFAIRLGPWKYVESLGSNGFSVPKKLQPKKGEASGQLYNITTDRLETHNVFLDHPDVVERMSLVLEQVKQSKQLRDVKLP